MGKKLTPEERAARIKAWEEAKAARKQAREERKKARIEAYEKAKAERKAKKRDTGRAIDKIPVSPRIQGILNLPSFIGNVSKGDRVCFRFLGMVMAGEVVSYTKERNYRIKDDKDAEAIQIARARGNEYFEFYGIKEDSDGTIYPTRRTDILAKWIDNDWKPVDSHK